MKNTLLVKICQTLLIIILGLSLVCGPATTFAQSPATGSKPIELKFASFFPAGNAWVTFFESWGADLAKRTNNRAKVTMYNGGVLGNDASSISKNILSGVTDIGTVGQSSPGQFPVISVLPASVPFKVNDISTMAEIMMELHRGGLLDAEIGKFKLLWVGGMNVTNIATTKKKINRLEDFKGMRMRVGGSVPALTKTGADIVMIPASELYTSIDKGMVDGLAGGPDLITAFQLQKMVRYCNLDGYGYGMNYILMNKDVFNRLPGDIQATIEQMNREMFTKNLDKQKEMEKQAVSALNAAGIDVYNFSPAETQRMAAATSGLLSDFVADMNKKGMPGTKINETISKVLAAQGKSK
jgi:TRAP-type C4-dicarboxylate transport system substrate-binding protein